jgi:hypothetical protein
LLVLLMTNCVAHGDTGSLAWWLLPNNSDDLPNQVEEDDNGVWTEIWGRPFTTGSSSAPNSVMEQDLGIKWIGVDADREGKPTHVTLVVGNHHVVDINGPITKLGVLDDEFLNWGDKTSQKLIDYKRRGRRRKKSAVINFGKILIPSLSSNNRELSNWSLESLAGFLKEIPNSTETGISIRSISSIAQLGNPDGSLLNFRYSPHCSTEMRTKIENAIASQVEPKLTCWLEQNPEMAFKFINILSQRPEIDCRPMFPAKPGACGMGTLPITEQFFAGAPKITIATQNCPDELSDTLLHEIFHLTGAKDGDANFATYLQQSESCHSLRADLTFEESPETFLNDLQVETRFLLFRKVRDESLKWNWSEGERAFVLGSLCSKLGDQCSRRFFRQASETNLQGSIELPEGGEVSFSSLAAFKLYDSIPEDSPRLHELVRYLHRDPNGKLLRRMETGGHHLHDLYIVRDTLEAVKNNRGICNGEVSEHVLCEDLAQIVKTPWFKSP